MKTPQNAKSGKPLPPGAHRVPGSDYADKIKGAVRPTPVQIGENFAASPKGGAPLVVGHRGVMVADNRTRTSR